MSRKTSYESKSPRRESKSPRRKSKSPRCKSKSPRRYRSKSPRRNRNAVLKTVEDWKIKNNNMKRLICSYLKKENADNVCNYYDRIRPLFNEKSYLRSEQKMFDESIRKFEKFNKDYITNMTISIQYNFIALSVGGYVYIIRESEIVNKFEIADFIGNLIFSNDSRFLIISSIKTIHIVDLYGDRIVSVLPNNTKNRRFNNTKFFTFINDTHLLVNNNDRLIMYEFDGRKWVEINSYKMACYKHIDYSQKSGLLAIATDDLIYIYEFADGTFKKIAEKNMFKAGFIIKILWSPDGGHLLIAKDKFKFIDIVYVDLNKSIINLCDYNDQSGFSNVVWIERDKFAVNSYDGKLSIIDINKYNYVHRLEALKSFEFDNFPDSLDVLARMLYICVNGRVYAINFDTGDKTEQDFKKYLNTDIPAQRIAWVGN